MNPSRSADAMFDAMQEVARDRRLDPAPSPEGVDLLCECGWRREDHAGGSRAPRHGPCRNFTPVVVPTPTIVEGGEGGCRCGGCGRRYRVDVQVPDALWPKIAGSTELLCPRCIAEGLEAQGEFAAFRLVDVDSAPTSRGTGVPSETARALVANHEKVAMAAAHLGATELGDAESAVLAHIAELEEQVRTLSAAAEQPEGGKRGELFRSIASELDHAYAKHGREPWGRHEFYAILLEEVEELKEAIFRDQPITDVLAELRQVAAMCFRYAETGDRYWGDHPAIPARGPQSPAAEAEVL